MTERQFSPANVAMLVQGTEVYGIGTIERLYAMHWSELTFIAMQRGPTYDWLRERGSQVELVEGLADYSSSRSWTMITRFPAAMRQAKRDAARIHERLARRSIRIVHAHWRPQQLIAGYLRRRGYLSVWQINNNTSRRRLAGLGIKLNHHLAKWGADLLLPASDFIAANWAESGVPMRTVLNAATGLFAGPNELPLEGPLRAVVAGRLETSKGHHVAVEAVIAARRAGYDVALDLFGGPLEDNAYAADLRRTIAAAGMETAFRFLGFCSDLRQRHQQYHLGLQCRIDPEPCSLWVCETLVDGLPLAASASGGTPELVEDGVTGLLYPPGSSEELARRIMELASDRPRLASMRRAAFERGRSHFRIERFLDETLAAYGSLKT